MSFLAGIVASIVEWLAGKLFTSSKADPGVVAQAQRDRADTLQSQKDAEHEADAIRDTSTSAVASTGPGDPGVFVRDPYQRD